LAGAVQGVENINQHYQEHRVAARELAETWFASDLVLPRLIAEAI
jgi:hypothetical protein